MKLLLLTLIFILSSCATVKEVFEPKSDMDEVHEHHRPLELQHLQPRPKYEGKLTNRVCTKFYGDKCESESIKSYDIKDKKVRERFIELEFACEISGKRYRFCPDKGGFCRKEKYRECKVWGRKFFSRKKICKKWGDRIVNKFIHIDDYQFLLDSRTECKKGL